MTQEQINLLLATLALAIPFIQFLLTKYFGKNKDRIEYSSDLLEIANKATEALKKTREDLISSEAEYEKTVDAMQKGHTAALDALRAELTARINRQKARIEDLERVTKIYTITFDLVTHPNLEIKNSQVKAMDDTSASQKMKAIREPKDPPPV